ncbi:serine/threonine-protein kinase RsbT [Deinobacterium chartae]|uniref:Serine/threonine-protein kinase RsbT n=1 Tax=Deinobacterium chartae TaxID=521158 RepID=A0A841I0Y7_9DEIO|nr:ATP-binding protein [Deinobacterium chartae]MBB6098756.1 serine/threonine-protein kinase RsbT [Deinobacterium chartae]
MQVQKRDTLTIRAEEDVVRLRQTVRRWAIELGFGLVDQTKLVTVASELARNTLIHGGGGTGTLEVVVSAALRQGLRLIFEDRGPGIPDVTLAFTDGYSSGSGLGLGLGGSRRLMNDLEVHTVPGQGTRVTAVKWK